MARSLTIRIEGRPPTPNARRHWRVTALDNETWKGAARICALAVKPDDWEPLTKARAEVTFVVGDSRTRDMDNLISSTKPLTDGLVAAGIIADDSLEVLVSVSYTWEYRKGETATVYDIREAA